jgi:hypothetical protein
VFNTIILHTLLICYFSTCIGLEPVLRTRVSKGTLVTATTEAQTNVNKNQYKMSDPIGVLKAATRTVRHHKKGWLQEDLLASGHLDGTKNALHAKVWADYNAQKLYIRAQQDILGEDFNPLHTIPGRDVEGKFAFGKTVDVPKNHLSLAYLLHAYDIDATTFKRLRQRDGAPLKKQVAHNKGKSVVVNQEYAESIYTPCYFFVKSQMRKWLENNQQATKQRKADRRKLLRKKWATEKEKDVNFGAGYDKKACDHQVRQQGTKGELVEIMNRNARRSYASLEKALNKWCSWKTIERFLKSNEDFTTYSQNIRWEWLLDRLAPLPELQGYATQSLRTICGCSHW